MLYSLEYVWIGGNQELRSKTRVLKKLDFKNIPSWNFDGSSTGQASGNNSEIILKPVKIFTKGYFLSLSQTIVLCDTYTPDGVLHPTNHRFYAKQLFDKKLEEKPWYGLEQEYFMIDNKTGKPLGLHSRSPEQGQYYCSVGAGNAFGRHIADEHMQACITSGIQISGINAEVAPGQWEFQIGPSEGIDAGDDLWVARYLLIKIAEKHDVRIDFEPKPLKGDWNGSGCHANFSTLSMREGTDEQDGLYYIDQAIEKLSHKHLEHMAVYGTGNEERMTGLNETARFDTFTDGIADRGCSIRRGNETYKNKQGYFEDRRPSSNCDPYLVTGKLFETICLDDIE